MLHPPKILPARIFADHSLPEGKPSNWFDSEPVARHHAARLCFHYFRVARDPGAINQ
jgi:hypothetical protein